MTIKTLGRDTEPGCDVSRWQGNINFAVFDLSFVVYKATGGDGGLYVDGKFRDNAAGFKTIEGGYHFSGRGDPKKEADWFCNNLLDSPWTSMDKKMQLPPTLDFEIFPSEWNDPVAKTWWCLTALERIQNRVNLIPILYTGPRSVGLSMDKALTQYPLWLAAYVSPQETWKYVAPWSDWTVWQTGSTGHVAGVQGNCDTDLINTSYLKSLGLQVAAPQQPNVPQEDLVLSDSDKQFISGLFRKPQIGRDEQTDEVFFVDTSEVKHHILDPALIDVVKAINPGIQDLGDNAATLSGYPEGEPIGQV